VTANTAYVPHYRMLLAGLGLAAIDPNAPQTTVDTAYLEFLIAELARLLPFDPAFYAAQTPAQAADGTEAQEHFARIGYRAGLLPHRLLFDAEYYAASNPELAQLHQQGGQVGLAAHFLQHGRFEGRAGHADTESDARRWAIAASRTGHELAHRSFADIVVQAFPPPLLGPAGRGFRGGPVLGDSEVELLLRHRRGHRAIDSFPTGAEPAGMLAGSYVYGGPYCDHFGHAMAEMIHRVLPARALFDCRRLLFVGPTAGWPPSGFEALPIAMQAPLRFLGVDPADVTVIHDTRVVERLHIAQQGSELGGGPRASYLRMLADFTPKRLAALQGNEPGAGKRLYVSRSRVIHGGLLLGEAYLERQLQREGWLVLHPQELPLLAQMQAYHRAETLLFAEGSACHGTELFGIDGLAQCVLLPRRAASLHVFENILRPRSQRFDVLPTALLLGGVLADPATGSSMDNLGVSLLDLDQLLPAMRDLGLATLAEWDLRAYRAIVKADLAAHIAHHRRQGSLMINDAALKALQARCTKALR
jgi:hypothetical protein